MSGIIEIRSTTKADLGALADYILEQMPDFVGSLGKVEWITGAAAIFGDGQEPIVTIRFEDVRFYRLDDAAIKLIDQILGQSAKLGLTLSVHVNGDLFRQPPPTSDDEAGKHD